MKVKVKIPKRQRTYVPIHTDFIRLDQALKLASVVQTGGEAKEIVTSGLVRVNFVPCLQRGKKLRHGDKFEFDGRLYEVKDENRENQPQ